MTGDARQRLSRFGVERGKMEVLVTDVVQWCEQEREREREMKFFILEKEKRKSGGIVKIYRVFVNFFLCNLSC